MSTAARRRLMRDFKVRHPRYAPQQTAVANVQHAALWADSEADIVLQRMQTDPPAGVSASPIADNVMTW